MTDPIDFVVLTGFLGSGKTTLLRDVLSGTEGGGTAVIVNEVGEIGLDGALLREGAGGTRMAMLSNGCICCQMGSDLAVTVRSLLEAERPEEAGPLERIVLETSGLSKPGPILRQLATLGEYPLRASVVTTYDVLRADSVADFEEAAAQWAGAHRIVATKTDAVAEDVVAALPRILEGLNPLAEHVVATERGEAVRRAFAKLTRMSPVIACGGGGETSPHPRISVQLAVPRGPIAYDDLAAWLDNLAGALGDRLLRLKGLVRVRESEYPLLVQSVGTLFSPPRAFAGEGREAASFLVVIARDLEEGELAAVTPLDLMECAPRREAARRLVAGFTAQDGARIDR